MVNENYIPKTKWHKTPHEKCNKTKQHDGLQGITCVAGSARPFLDHPQSPKFQLRRSCFSVCRPPVCSFLCCVFCPSTYIFKPRCCQFIFNFLSSEIFNWRPHFWLDIFHSGIFWLRWRPIVDLVMFPLFGLSLMHISVSIIYSKYLWNYKKKCV